MEKSIISRAVAAIALVSLGVACTPAVQSTMPSSNVQGTRSQSAQGTQNSEDTPIALTSQITKLAENFFAAEFNGDDGFEEFLANGGAESDAEVVEFLATRLLADFDILGGLFGCSTIAVKSPQEEQLFGRNFDWESCEALVLVSKPKTGYASISTVNMDFITQKASGAIGAALSINDIRILAALYAPLDGMNEKGLAVAVNMIQDAANINQNTDKPDITTTTAIRLLLNKATNVDEAVQLLEQYDMNASMGLMMHLAIADATGQSVAVEYINNEMVVTKTPVVTNFYLAQGDKHGIGSAQSHERYDILMKALADNENMSDQAVKNALDSVSKDNFEEFASTEWSVVFNQDKGVTHYYHREDYETQYTFKIN